MYNDDDDDDDDDDYGDDGDDDDNTHTHTTCPLAWLWHRHYYFVFFRDIWENCYKQANKVTTTTTTTSTTKKKRTRTRQTTLSLCCVSPNWNGWKLNWIVHRLVCRLSSSSSSSLIHPILVHLWFDHVVPRICQFARTPPNRSAGWLVSWLVSWSVGRLLCMVS